MEYPINAHPLILQCGPARVTISPVKSFYKYSVKVVNPARKSDYVVKKMHVNSRFAAIREEFKKLLEITTAQIGYIEPGHGLKGKQRWLTDNDDIEEMYDCFKGRNEIVMWCLPATNAGTSSKKRTFSTSGNDKDTDGVPPPKKSSIAQKITEVEGIVKTLQEKHGKKYSVEQLNAWAHLIHVEKRSSQDPPLICHTSEGQRNVKHLQVMKITLVLPKTLYLSLHL